MSWSFSADKPIFQQLVDIITLDIVSGRYAPGERLAPVRELAVTAGVNPNTMQRALAQIEETGLIFTKRGEGRFVGTDLAAIAQARETYVRQSAEAFIASLQSLGLSPEEIVSAVKKYLADGQPEKTELTER